mmetsp:Transcript_21974/g.51536  ORF Transcript_21974/g.51536 Transcript_21974/m.51536 type:complete len:84 (+) Transcript_21974:754-1005(+)
MGVAAGGWHTSTVEASDELVCFHGECHVPPTLGPVVALSAGDGRTCAVKASSDLVCFRDDPKGQYVPATLGLSVSPESHTYRS